jgi:hypothetical protein
MKPHDSQTSAHFRILLCLLLVAFCETAHGQFVTLSVDTTTINLGVPAGGTSSAQIHVTTSSPATVSISSTSQSWLSVSPGGLQAVSSAAPLTLTVTANLSGTNFAAGTNISGTFAVSVFGSSGTSVGVTVNVSVGAMSSTLSLSSLSPNSATAAGPAFSFTVNGSGFLVGSSVLWNGSPLATSYASANQLTASVPANLIAAQGTSNITVQNPGGAVSNALTFTINSSALSLSGLSPNSATAGGPSFTLTVNGSGFLIDSNVVWNGTLLTTSYVNGNQLVASVPAYLIASQGIANVAVQNRGGATSSALAFSINAAASPLTITTSPTLPSGATYVYYSQTLNATGGIPPYQWLISSGYPCGLSLGSSTGILSGSPSVAGTCTFTVSVSDSKTNGVPAFRNFSIAIDATPAPALTSISPSSGAPGTSVGVTLSGTNFIVPVAGLYGSSVSASNPGIVVSNVNVVNSTTITATLTIAANAALGTSGVRVNTYAGTSNTATFTVSPQPSGPSLTNVSPNSATSGGTSFTLTVNGAGFLAGSSVLWNGSYLSTIYISGNQLSSSVPANFIASPGSAGITVVNPGGSVSNALTFTINQQTSGTPTITSLSPNSTTPGGPAFTLTVYGSGFVNGAVVLWNGSPLSTTFQGSTTQLTASVPASLAVIAGTASITVVNPSGMSSNSIGFPVTSINPLRISQIADGSGWKTLFEIINLDQMAVNYSVQFWDDNGNPLQLPFVNGPAGSFAGALAVGGTAFAETPGTASALTQGWANVASSGRIGVLTIFRQSVPGRPDSEGTVTGVQSGNRVFLPFDNTNGYVTGVAVANTNATQTLLVSMMFQTDSGSTSTGSLPLPPHAHMAFVLTSMFPGLAGLRGSIEFTASTPDIAVVGLRFSPTNSFTSLGVFQ